MKIKKIYLILLFVIFILAAFLLIYKDVMFQEGSPLPIIKGIIELNDTNTFVKIKYDPLTYLTKTSNNVKLFEFVEEVYNVIFKDQFGSGYIFEGEDKRVIVSSRQYSRFYQIWRISLR